MATNRLQIVTDIRADADGIRFQTSEIDLPPGTKITRDPEWKTVVELSTQCPEDGSESPDDD